MDFTSDQFIAKLKTLPPEIDTATSSYRFLATLYTLALEFGLNKSQTEEMVDATTLRAVDLISENDFMVRISKIPGLPGEKAQPLVAKIKTEVLNKLSLFATTTDISSDEFAALIKKLDSKQVDGAGLSFLDEKLGASTNLQEKPIQQDKKSDGSLPSVQPKEIEAPGQTPAQIPQTPSSPTSPPQPPPKKVYPGGADPYREPV